MEPTKALLVLLALCCLLSAEGFRPPLRTVEQHRARFLETSASRRSLLDEKSGRVFHPADYGADPTGSRDSADGIMKAVHAAFDAQKGMHLLQGINDLGGVVIDLQGGNYMISKPIRFPTTGGANLVFTSGTLRAMKPFPSDGFLVEQRSESSSRRPAAEVDTYDPTVDADPNNGHGVHYEDITFRDVLFDASFMAGDLLVVDSVRTRVDNCYFIHFTSVGLLVEGGHETYVSSSFFGQYETAGGDPREKTFSGIAIDLASNDNALTDVVIFAAATGIVLRGQANMLTGVHCYNKATYWGGVGIHAKLAGLGQTRISNSYMDYTDILLEDPVQVHITNGFFLGDAAIKLKAMKGKISGLIIVDNMFSGNSDKPIVETDGWFSDIDQVVIDRNNVRNMRMKSTVARMVVGGNGTKWAADFSPELVFPDRIRHVQYSLYAKGDPTIQLRNRVTLVEKNQVVVESARPVDGVLSVYVDQNSRPGEKNLFK